MLSLPLPILSCVNRGANRSVLKEHVPFLGPKISVPGKVMKNLFFGHARIRFFTARVLILTAMPGIFCS